MIRALNCLINYLGESRSVGLGDRTQMTTFVIFFCLRIFLLGIYGAGVIQWANSPFDNTGRKKAGRFSDSARLKVTF